MRFKVRKIVYENVNVPRDEVMTLAEAAKFLGITINGIKQYMKNNKLTWLESNADYHGRLLVLRDEIEDLKRYRETLNG